MPDYSKFVMKDDAGVARLLEGRDNLVVLACNKCFKAFTAESAAEPETGHFIRLAEDLGKSIISVCEIDFLCNRHRLQLHLDSKKELLSEYSRPCVICISCGIGTQAAAGLIYGSFPHVPVLTACESVSPASASASVPSSASASVPSSASASARYPASAPDPASASVPSSASASVPSSASASVIVSASGRNTVAAHDNETYQNSSGLPWSSAQHALALTDKLCAACGQCLLNQTGGICPITGCPKTLLCGPCGGASDGKCETGSGKDCVWEKIYKSTPLGISQQPECGNIHYSLPHSKKTAKPCSELPQTPISALDYDRVKRSDTSASATSVQMKRNESFPGGVYLSYRKDCTAFLTLQKFPLPSQVVVPMSQHAGTSADPIVRVGDHVKVGQKIGEAVGTISSSVHASICGTVSDISYRSHPNFIHDSLCVTIDSDGRDELHKSVMPIPYWDDLDIFDIDAIIAEKGIVGMGGAGFPTPVKLKSPKPIDTILLNGCESEPYITADHRIMLEKAGDIITGLQIVMKCTGAKRGIIVISDNKSDAIAHLEAKTAHFDDVFVMALWSKYPQGAERMLLLRTLGRKLGYGQRPYDAGAIVLNVSTARAIGDAFTTGMPLIERAVTVSGEKVRNPGNYMVRIGTSVEDILNHCGVISDNLCIKLGGPMMGATPGDLNVPVIKGTNAVLAREKPLTRSFDCIRCGRCVDVCPMELLPLCFPMFAARGDRAAAWADCPEKNATNCIECGACDYICPSGIEICKAVRICKNAK